MDYAVFNIRGLTDEQVVSAIEAAQKAIESDDIREMWFAPEDKCIWVAVSFFPCMKVPHTFGTGVLQCQ